MLGTLDELQFPLDPKIPTRGVLYPHAVRGQVGFSTRATMQNQQAQFTSTSRYPWSQARAYVMICSTSWPASTSTFNKRYPRSWLRPEGMSSGVKAPCVAPDLSCLLSDIEQSRDY